MTIGIGAGKGSGQVLVLHDMLNITAASCRASCAISWRKAARSMTPFAAM
jgi:ketopantoate hydroxymethyltransferase